MIKRAQLYRDGLWVGQVLGVTRAESFPVDPSSPYNRNFGVHFYGTNRHGEYYIAGMANGLDWRLV